MSNELQSTILLIVDEIIRICEKYNITYGMDGGTFLGAVRHKGFIPWDDDLDLGMERVEYDRFLKACEMDLNKEMFTLQTVDVEEYCFSFAKLHLNGTCIIEDFSSGVNVHHGIFVDIFPFDDLPVGLVHRKMFLWNNKILKNLIWVRCNYGTSEQRNTWKYKCYKILGKPFSVRKLKEKREKMIRKYNGKGFRECFNSDYPDHIIKKEWLQDVKLYSFEDRKLNGATDYDGYLIEMFGDYMKLPPEDQRQTHTKQEIDFGIYK